MARADLHIHTTASDGVLSPAGVIELASRKLEILSVTDHNTLSGLEEAGRAAASCGVILISGVELSAQPEEGDEVHILGYGFDSDRAPLDEICVQIVQRKNEQMWRIVELLEAAGVGIDSDGLPDGDAGDYVGRPLLAEMLVRSGAVHSVQQAFARFLGTRGDAYVPMRPLRPEPCIEAVHAAGGVAVLAHPRIRTVDQWIAPLSAAGLDGVEAHRPALTGNQQLYVEKAAEQFGLFVTGGSDWHGRSNDAPLGEFGVPVESLRDLLERLGRGG